MFRFFFESHLIILNQFLFHSSLSSLSNHSNHHSSVLFDLLRSEKFGCSNRIQVNLDDELRQVFDYLIFYFSIIL
jgi:hypothetical protein